MSTNYKIIALVAAFLAVTVAVPLAHAQTVGYPYSYFTGPSYFVGGGGFYQGNVFNPYAAYGPATITYNPMTGQGNFGSSYGYVPGYGTNYGSSYGSGGYNYNAAPVIYGGQSYGSTYGTSGCSPYIPANACAIMTQYGYSY